MIYHFDNQTNIFTHNFKPFDLYDIDGKLMVDEILTNKQTNKMQTKFKVGDKVYDSLNFPNQEFIVSQIDMLNLERYVIFIANEHNKNCYTHDGRYLPNQQPSLSLTPYEVEFKGFTQERPKVLTDEMKVCYVGKKIEYNGSIFLILQQDKESVDILLDGKQEVIMIDDITDDITNGLYRIID